MKKKKCPSFHPSPPPRSKSLQPRWKTISSRNILPFHSRRNRRIKKDVFAAVEN
jgi:hypothetical protein